jgi:Rne/Rng family ribonuclease
MTRPEPSRLFVAERGEERHVALWRQGRLAGYRIDAPGLSDRSGALFLGQVVRVDPGLGSAFVAFDKPESGVAETGLLPLRRGEKRVEGDRLLVQMGRDRSGEKAARLTAAPILEGRFVDLLAKEHGVHMTGAMLAPEVEKSLRTALRGLVAQDQIGLRLTPRASQASVESILKEASGLVASWRICSEALKQGPSPRCLRQPPAALPSLLQDLPSGDAITVVADNRTLARRIESELAAASAAEIPAIEVRPQQDWIPSAAELDEAVRGALDPRVPLADGGWILFEPGETLTAIDVNSGTASGRRSGASPADLRVKLNLQAVETIAWQLRLRAIGGLVVIDFVDMGNSADRDRVVKALRGAFAEDPARIRVLPMSDLGLVQVTRQRRGAPLAELFFRPCEACDATGRLMLRRPIGNSPI